MSDIDDFLEQALKKKAPTELGDLLEFYTLSARARGDSEKTIGQTATAINLLCAYLARHGLSTNAVDIGPSQLRNFIYELQRRPKFADHPYVKPQNTSLSRNSVNSYLRALRAAWNDWVQEGLLEVSPFSYVKIPKAQKKIIPTLSEEQLTHFFN
ncbi:MAG: tyrosine recombinase XerC, partial [Dehalococcoidales bacterium]